MNLIWFRSDLRVDDNPALYHACNTSDNPVVAVYLYSPGQMKTHGIGRNQQRLLSLALLNLEAELTKFNIPLIIINSVNFAKAPIDILSICRQLKVNSIFLNREYTVNEISRDQQVFELIKSEVEINQYDDQCLIPPQEVTKPDNSGYKVFTAYAKRVNYFLVQNGQLCFPSPAPRPTSNFLAAKPVLINTKSLDLSDKIQQELAPPLPNINEKSLNDKLATFCDKNISGYSSTRNIPSISGTSELSSGLALGVISARRCYQRATENPMSSSHSWTNELIWRDFYRSVMWHFPRVSKNNAFNPLDKYLNWRKDSKDLALWKQAKTGVPIIDAAISQLLNTGWMHNRCRMIVASYLTKNLWIDWREGERFFSEHLFDFDFASNNGGWQWSASIGTDAAPYYRVFNPALQQLNFDKDALYIKKWLPVLSDIEPKEIHNFEKNRLRGYHNLQVDLKASRKIAIANFKQVKEMQKSFSGQPD